VNVTTRPQDGQIGITLNKTEQDTLQQTAALSQDLLHQLDQRVSDGQTTPEQVAALRTLATAMLTGARGVISTSNRQAPVYSLSPLVPIVSPPVMTVNYPFDPTGSLIRPVLGLGQRTTMTNDI
jgi:hypothetical protein